MFMPSAQETFGLAIIEGAASGLPVVVRDIPDYDSTFGNYVLRGDESNFREYILQLKNDKTFMKKWRDNSRKLAKKYDSAEATKKLIELYKEMAEK